VKVAIAAAGTGGHVNPALSVAEALLDRGLRRSDILFMGGDRFASEAAPAAGFPFVGFELTHLRRSLSLENLRIPIVLRRTSAAMAREIGSFGATAVLGMSGYVTVPAAMAARRAGVPFVLQEQNSVPGLAARYASRRAQAVFVGLPGKAEELSGARLVGNPLRPTLDGFDRGGLRSRARTHYGMAQDGSIVGIVGGSQGAAILNRTAAGVAAIDGVDGIVHLAGPAAHAEMAEQADRSSLPWRCLPYEPNMELFYAAVDVAVCRAGAMTVTELAATGTPSVLVPLARVGQQGNAAVLEAAGGAVVVPEGEAAAVPDRLAELVGDEQRLAAMSHDARSVHRSGAATVIAEHLMGVARG
jgi:UDP-N-acetylglucosamine--N-acetylmuramyl-(pentapeptide) pyrophosphoryl-undecaprenol N-acetylglucosamine transferase